MKNINFTKHNCKIHSNGYMLGSLFSEVERVAKTIPNGDYELIIRKKVKNRSLSQNALMWLWYACVENETGQNKDDVHAYYCKRFLAREVEIFGKIETVIGGTRNLTTVEFKHFLDRVQVIELWLLEANHIQ